MPAGTRTTTASDLSREQRAAVFDEILRELGGVCPELFDAKHDLDPGGLVELYGHVDDLVAIVRRTTSAAAAGRMEPYLLQVRERICTKCPHKSSSGFCSLRDRNSCALSAHATRIARAVGRALRQGPDTTPTK